MSRDADGYRRSPEKGGGAVADGPLKKCFSGVIDVMCFIFLIIPHSAETLGERWLGGCTGFLNMCVLVCLFSAGSSDNSLGLCLVSQTGELLLECRWRYGWVVLGALVLWYAVASVPPQISRNISCLQW